jgi:DNA repair protein SbcC/Rad50
MILKNVALTPFGGLTNKQLDFQPGLNVIFGPNEAGKSTVFNAIQRVLFTPAKLTPSVFKREMADYLPLPDGDTIAVSLCIDFNGDTYLLKKEWGATKSAALSLPGGSLITDEGAIQEQLVALMPAKEGTFKTVLMTYQSGLARTIEDLETQQEPIQTLGNILRRAIFETDGVSVDQFKDNIEAEHTAYFSRWDRERGCPESSTRYKRDVGKILQAHYYIADTQTALQEAERYESELDLINHQINTCVENVETIETYIEENEKVVGDARQRQSLTDRLDAIQARMETHRKDNREWPVAENEVERIKASLPGLKEKETALATEQEIARKKEERDQLRRKFGLVEKIQEELGEAEQALQQTPELSEDDLEALRNTYAKLNELKAGVTASKLSVRLYAKTALAIGVEEGLAELQTKDLAQGDTLTYDEGSRIKISHQDWEIDISSGENNFDDLLQDFENTEEHLNTLLEQHDVENLEAAILVSKEYTAGLQVVNSARDNLASELGDDTYEDLEAKVAEIGEVEASRDLEIILEELLSVRGEISNQEGDLEQHQERIEELVHTYESQDQLLLTLAEEARAQKEAQEKIEALVPLPDGVEDIEAFIEMFEEKQSQLAEETQSKTDLLIQRANLERVEPKVSAEEIDHQLTELTASFEKVLKRGDSIGRIKDLTDRLMEEMDSNTYKGLVTDLEQYVVLMTENRYAQIDMEESMPKGFIRQDGVILPYDLLSAGTRDVLALSLRLAMANHFLMDANGMLMLDDPLVDLDPRRQEKAAEAFGAFAKNKQVIVFTCHPHHADLLGGNRIEL